ncbi:hypothetical protein FHS89_002567 [Rubricella aquisinus]|uniref:DUF3168 domain-containing protein n=1 Tax=Rubricella aquisinus TaxID=2028108 RepID=A0A840X405_9RHOB|nr:DUF3168 domain-containing protein [Rubricella aquisinus]MBB5516536.1 hypothetical protein [Rubricella aquisinus]
MTGLAYSWPLQQAVFDRLSTESAVTTQAQVFDAVPSSVAVDVDYITLGTEDAKMRPEGEICSVRFDIVVHSPAPGFARAKAIAAAVTSALDAAPLVIAGARLLNLRFERARAARGRGMERRRITLTYHALIAADG